MAEVWDKLNAAARDVTRSTISSESRWFSTCSTGLPQARAVDTDQRMSDKPRYYITTAIAYPNGAPHIGTPTR